MQAYHATGTSQTKKPEFLRTPVCIGNLATVGTGHESDSNVVKSICTNSDLLPTGWTDNISGISGKYLSPSLNIINLSPRASCNAWNSRIARLSNMAVTLLTCSRLAARDGRKLRIANLANKARTRSQGCQLSRTAKAPWRTEGSSEQMNNQCYLLYCSEQFFSE